MRQSVGQDNSAGQQYTLATSCPAAQQHGAAKGPAGSSASSGGAVFYGMPPFYSTPCANFGSASSATACTSNTWGQFSSLSLGPHNSSGGGAHSMHSSSGGSNHFAYPSASASFPAAGWPTSTQAGQYFGYAAVPCIMVPTGDPVFYTQLPTRHHSGVEHGALRHTASNGGGGDSVHQLQLAAPSTSYVQQLHHHSNNQQQRGQQRKHRHTSQQHSMDSLYGTHSRSVSSFSSMAGFYAVMDSSSEASQQDASQQDDPYGLRARIASGSEAATSWGHLTVGILQRVLNQLADAEVKQLRGVCRHWRAAVDHNLDSLTPSSLMSKLITLRFPNLKLLHLTNCSNVRNRDLQLLSNGGLRLHTLTLGDDANRPWVSNIGLAWIGKVTTLTALNLQDCTQLTNRGLLPLQQLTGLAALSLKGCNKLNNMGLEGLRHNTALTSLNLTGCIRISDKGLLPLTALPNLLSLHLGGTRVKDEGMEYLARITTLHDLHFAREAITDAGIMQLSTLTNLQTLALRECPQVTGDSLSALVPQLSNLQSLDLFQSYDFDDAQLAKCLDFLGSVTFLDLRGTVVSEEGIQQLARLQNLQKLCLAPKTEIRVEQHLCVVSHLTQLTSLAINNCRLVSFDLMASLAHLKLLRELDISNNGQTTAARASDMTVAREPVNDGAIRAMTNITSLTSIDLSRRSVHEDQLNVLAEHLPKLRTLFVVGCPVLYETLQSLHRRFPELVIHRKPLHDPPPLSCSSSEHGFM